MAEIENCPADLRALARRVPDRIRMALSPLELEIRCTEAASILAEAEDAGEGRKGDKLRRDARNVLNAVAPDGFHLTVRLMNDQIREFRLQGADKRAAMLEAERDDFVKRNRQPDPERAYAVISREVGKLMIPPATQSKIFRRKRRG
jgi:hypothetical protein